MVVKIVVLIHEGGDFSSARQEILSLKCARGMHGLRFYLVCTDISIFLYLLAFDV